jgi:serine/threonine protein kinase/tetratricopeptide (TPR) repeat protein
VTVVSEARLPGAGHVFAARYRLVHELRSTAGSEVWRADDLQLQKPVALEILQPAPAEDRQRVLEAMRIARQFTHPVACRVMDLGEADGRVYCSLELVNGQSLRHLVRQAGRLPSERVVEIGRQLCWALAALHYAGVRPRIDLSTILLDLHGSVRIVDLGFGTAAERPAPSVRPGRRRADPRTATAVPWEPEQAHATGAVLYELAVGAPPDFALRTSSATDAAGKPVRPSSIVPDMDARLERAILDALSPVPQKRPASAAAMAMALTALPGATGADVRGWMSALGVVALIAGALALLATWLVPKAPTPLGEHDTIVLADFANSTGNPVFDRALNVALAVALEQSPFLRVFPDERARETLRLMQRDADERITADLAREIARRQQLKALVTGSIASRRGQYVVTLEAVDAGTAGTIAREQAVVTSEDRVLRALGGAAARLRSQLGESLASVQRFDTPLPQATTTSLEALHAFALAHDEGRLTPRVEAIPHLQRAIELDPGFAMALAALSGVYRNTGRSAEAPAFSRRAFELRDRVSERERFVISWRYYVDAAQAWDQALELSASWTRTYPREAAAFNSLGLASAAFGDHPRAVSAFLEAIRLDPAFIPPHGNVVGSLIASNRYGDAKARLAEAQQRGIGFITVRRMAYLLAFIEQDAPAMARELELARKSSEAASAALWEARVAAFRGQHREAHDLFQRAVQAASAGQATELAAQWTTEDAEVHAVAGDCDAARGEATAALAMSRDNFTLERAGRTLALCGDAAAARLTEELRTRFPEATLTLRLHLPVIAAAAALRRGEPARAIELLEPVAPYDHAPSAEFWPMYLRGEAYLQMKNGRAAAEQFRTILARRGQAPTSPIYALAGRQLPAAETLVAGAASAVAAAVVPGVR